MLKENIKSTYAKNNFELLLSSIFLFVVNPFIAVMIVFHLLYSKLVLPKERLINFLIWFLAFFLAFINLTKIPENDLHFHGLQYTQVKGFSLLGYLKAIYKEPMGYIFDYVCYHLSGGSLKFWILSFSLISYLFFFKAIKLFFLKIKAPINLIVLGLILGAFFPQLFSLSAHLIRQFIASAIFIYFAVDKIFYKNNKWWLVVLGVLTHASSLILFSLVYLKFLGNFKQYRFINIFLIILLLFYQKIADLLLPVFGGISPFVRYILERASRNTNFDLGSFPWLNFVMMLVMIIIVLISKKLVGRYFNKSKITEESENDSSELEQNFIFFFTIMIILSFFILSNLHQSELSIRLFFYLFFYFPFVFPLLIGRFKNRAIISYFISVLFIFFFAYRLEFGVWHYASLFEIVTSSVFSFLTRPEPVI